MRLILMFAGALPFAAGAAIAVFGLTLPTPLSAWPDWYRTYALVIGSFMAGTLWQPPIPGAPGSSTQWLILSNLAALGLWTSAGILDRPGFLVFAAIVFLGLLICDYRRGLDADYVRARTVVTILVCSCLLIVAVSL